ncbi:MAG: S9 family peptidase [Planctomycetes bacterium]|nr:S9 family peptidase [Planctomycetota bacterium]
MSFRSVQRFFVLLFASLIVSAVAAQEKHPLTVEDLLEMEKVADPQASPDSRHAVFVRSTLDLEEDKYRSNLWTVEVDGGNLRQLTSHPEDDTHPRWAPDGKTIYFLSRRSETSQIWQIAIDGGESIQVTDQPLDIQHFTVSPDGKHLAFAMDVFPDCENIDETKKKLDEIEESKSTGRIYDRLLIRHWNVWADGRRSHLFVMPVDSGEPIDVMKGMDADCPSKPFGGSAEFTFSIDGRELIFASRDVGEKEAWSTNFDLYRVPIDGSEAPENITAANPAWDTAPTFSPDGRTLAYLATSRPGYESDNVQIILRSWPMGEERVLAPDRDLSIWMWFGFGVLRFSPDGQTIYTTPVDTGQIGLFGLDCKTDKVETLIKKGSVGAPSVTKNRILFTWNDRSHPPELYSVNPDGSDRRQLTYFNREKLAALRLGEDEQFTFRGWNNETVYGYVVKPVGLDAEKKYPVILSVHGGPQASSLNRFAGHQIFAGKGYAVVMIDYHGSAGYGQAFTDSINNDWGGKPLEDLQKGLAAALKKYPWMDGKRIGASGGSYGGYMMNWIAGNWPDRFRCLVNVCGLFDLRSMYYSTEELWFPEWDFIGTPWQGPENYEKHNPANYVQHWKTPTLVVHGEQDFRVPDTQGIATFTALQRRGIESKLLYFPDEGHGVRKPHNVIQFYNTVLEWFDYWLKTESDVKKPI